MLTLKFTYNVVYLTQFLHRRVIIVVGTCGLLFAKFRLLVQAFQLFADFAFYFVCVGRLKQIRVYFQIFKPVSALVVLSRLFRLTTQRLYSRLSVALLIGNTHKIRVRSFKVALRALLLSFVSRNPRRFLEYTASFFGFYGKQSAYLSLTYYAVTRITQARVLKFIHDFTLLTRSTVDAVLAFTARFARPYHFASNDYFVYIKREKSRLIIEKERNFAIRHTLTRFRSFENKVLLRRTAKCRNATLSQNPAYSVRNVTLAATVRSDYCRNVVIEYYFQFVGKRFESVNLYLFESNHLHSARIVFTAL